MAAIAHPDYNGRGLCVFHEDGSMNLEALTSLLVLAGTRDLVLVSRADLHRLIETTLDPCEDDPETYGTAAFYQRCKDGFRRLARLRTSPATLSVIENNTGK